MITRENYEEYFLLYVDNELPAAVRTAVEEFVAANPDLREDWEALRQCTIHPSAAEPFPDKELLLQLDLLSYIDGEGDEDCRRTVEAFVASHPAKALELRQLLMTVSHPDLSMTCPDKDSLYRTTKKRAVLLPFLRVGIAASLLGIAALVFPVTSHRDAEKPAPGTADTKKISPRSVTPAITSPLNKTGSDDPNHAQTMAQLTTKDQRESGKRLAAPNKKAAAAAGQPKNADAGGQHRKADVAAGQLKKANGSAGLHKNADIAAGQQEPGRQSTATATLDKPVTRSAVIAEPGKSEPTVATTIRPDAVERTPIPPPTAGVAVNIPKEQSSFATQALMEEAQGDDAKAIADAAPAGRNRLRGIFRKVSRSLGKTADRGSDGQKEVLISAFQVALK